MSKKSSNSDNRTLDPETWVDQYGDYLYNYTISRVHDPNVAEDLVQETFLAALRSRDNFKFRSSERTWLTGIIKNKIVDYFRRQAKERLYDDVESQTGSLDELFNQKGQWEIKPAEWNTDPLKVYEQHQFMKVLHDCLTKLSGRMASAFILREIMGKDTKEICKILNITATNCWVILHRSRMHLRRCLEIKWFTSDNTEN